MAYLESNLGKDEKIISKAQVSFLPIISNALAGLAVLILFASAGSFPIGLIAAAVIIVPKLLRIRLTELGLTNKKIMGKYGIINTKVMDSPLNKVNSVSVEQGLGGKIFGYGKIVVSTSSGGYNFNYVKNADTFRSTVMNQIDLADEERIRRQAQELAGAVSRKE